MQGLPLPAQDNFTCRYVLHGVQTNLKEGGGGILFLCHELTA